MQKIRLALAAMIVSMFLGFAGNASADEGKEAEALETELSEIYAAGMDLTCIDWKPTGMCIWLYVNWPVVSIRYSTLVEFYSPDALTEVYHKQSNTPLLSGKLQNSVSNTLGSATAGSLGGLPLKLENNSSSTEGFRSAHLMGNPMLSLHNSVLGGVLGNVGYCESPVNPLQTYYHSDLDWFEWRAGFIEALLYFPNMLKRVYDGSAMWGSLYPRVGWGTNNSSPFISAAITSLRAANIVSGYDSFSSNHIQVPMPDENPRFYYPPNTQPKVDIENGKWKALWPAPTDSCSVLPISGITSEIGTNEPYVQNRNYVFMLWRKYTCCKRKGQKLISIVGG